MNPQNVLSFWRDVEIFNLPDHKDTAPLAVEDILPWLEGREPSSPYKVWRYTLYFGRLSKAAVIDVIESALGITPEKEDWIEPVPGYTCLSSLVLDEHGRPDERSYVQASFLHGINCLLNDEPVSNVVMQLTEAQENFELRYQFPSPDEKKTDPRKGDVVTRGHLEKECAVLAHLTKEWRKENIVIFYTAKEVQRDTSPEAVFLNSFFLDDLEILIGIHPKHYGHALKEYLAESPAVKERRDLMRDPDELMDVLNPALIPAGRWPANISWGLYTGQAGAVNMAVHELKDNAGIRGINGPPGTGKTTLLLDVIAEVVVLRASEMVHMEHHKLFDRTYNKIDNVFGGYYCANSRVFHDKGIVVSSNNNVAVENITEALPASAKIDRKEFPEADYFGDYAGRMIAEETWGILGAALGNSGNRLGLKLNFWESRKEPYMEGFEDLLWNVYRDDDDTAYYAEKYDTARFDLKELLASFDRFRLDAAAFHALLPGQLKNSEKKTDLEIQITVYEQEIEDLAERQRALGAKLAEMDASIQAIQRTLLLHYQHKPVFFFIQKLFRTKAFRKWNEPVQRYLSEMDALVTERKQYERVYKENEAAIAQKKKYLGSLHTELDHVTAAMKHYAARRQYLHETYNIPYEDLIDDVFYRLPVEEKHLRKPYASPEINRLRSVIFFKALEVHKYAILSNAKQFRNNLRLFMEMTTGKAIVSGEIAKELWSTLFFCVPVVSTALASVSRMLSDCGKETIGWLLLDEAGQATPQSAAGIISRSKRCIIIGDPLQVEPVVTIPAPLVNKLRQQYDLEEIWSPVSTSVQLLADRISTRGTYMDTQDEPIWTGFPLRTHRRCNNPMFSIANQIAYNGQMVRAEADQPLQHDVGPSAWFHVAGTSVSNKQVIGEELDLLKEKVQELIVKGYKGQIFIISPFKSVQRACKKLFPAQKDAAEKQQVQCGTIHAFQGREADIVFLVLGSDPASPRSRDWASKKPNMLNVALTRAKKRIYVIGNKNIWSKHPYFSVMAARI